MSMSRVVRKKAMFARLSNHVVESYEPWTINFGI